MLIYTSNLRYNWSNYVLLKSRQHFKRYKYETSKNKQYGAKLLGNIKRCIKMDRRHRIYVYKINKKSIDKLKKKKVDRKLQNKNRIDRRLLQNSKRVNKKQAEIASKDQI